MKPIITVILLISAFTLTAVSQKPDSSKPAEPKATPAAKLPEAKEIVEKYIKAVGGRDALTKQKSRYQKADIELSPMGIKGTTETFSRSDDRLLVKTTLTGVGDILVGFDGTTGWTVNPIQGNRTMQGRELLQTKRSAFFGRQVSFDKLYTSMRVRGVEAVGDRQAYAVVASAEGLPDDVMFFDTETGLMVRSDIISVSPEGEQASSNFYDDYRDVDGTKVPFKGRVKTPAFEMIINVTEVKYNLPMEDAKFAQPK